MNVKQSANWKSVSVVLVFLLVSTVAYSFGYVQRNVQIGFTSPDVYLDDLPFTATYVIKTNGTYYWAVQYDGKICWSSTNASYVTNSAFSALTSNRTWLETVISQGNFTFTNSVLIPSYTLLTIQGKWTLANGANCDIMRNADALGNTQIVIEGGTLDGNYANQAVVTTHHHAGIFFTLVNDARIEGVVIQNCLKAGVKTTDSNRISILHNTFINNAMTYQYWGQISVSCEGTPSVNSEDILIEGNTVRTTVNPSIDRREISAYAAVDGAAQLRRVTIANNFIDGNTLSNVLHAIEVSGYNGLTSSYFPTIEEVVVSGNHAYRTSDKGIDINGAMRVTVIGNTVEYATNRGLNFESDSQVSAIGNNINHTIYGIYYGTNKGGFVCSNNIINYASKDGIYIYPATAPNTVVSTEITGNNVDFSGRYGIHCGLSGVSIDNNIVRNSTSYNIFVSLERAELSRCRISGNYLLGSPTGVCLNAGSYCIVSNNIFVYQTDLACIIDNGKGNIISGNQFWGNPTKNALYLLTQTNSQVLGNQFYNTYRCLTLTSTSTYNLVSGNVFDNTNPRGIFESSTSNYNVIQNNVFACTSYQISSDNGLNDRWTDNLGYNPLGYLATPISGSTYNLVDAGNNATWVSAATYTNRQSPKTLYINGGVVTAIVQNGRTLATVAATMSIVLQPSDTFSVTFSVAPAINVLGR